MRGADKSPSANAMEMTSRGHENQPSPSDDRTIQRNQLHRHAVDIAPKVDMRANAQFTNSNTNPSPIAPPSHSSEFHYPCLPSSGTGLPSMAHHPVDSHHIVAQDHYQVSVTHVRPRQPPKHPVQRGSLPCPPTTGYPTSQHFQSSASISKAGARQHQRSTSSTAGFHNTTGSGKLSPLLLPLLFRTMFVLD